MIRSAIATLVAAFALAHLPFLPASLEDIDSVNFALGIRDFDVAHHRPHPPGYPVYVALGKATVPLAGALAGDGAPSVVEARAMASLSLLGALVAIVMLYGVLSCLPSAGSDRSTPPWRRLDARALAATALTAACPLFWYMSARPMSDMPGLAAAAAALACLSLAWWRQRPTESGDRRLAADELAASGSMIVAGSLLAALAIGFRTQNAMLTLPLLAAVLLDRVGRGVAGALVGGGVAFAVGVLVWAAPLVAASGGLNAYLAALGTQAGEDFAGVPMLYLHPSPRLIADALLRTFVYPWDSLILGSAVVTLSAIGFVALALKDRRALTAIVVIALPYLIFHLLFQEVTFVRYALPLVPPAVYLAVCGLELIARRAALPIAGALALWAVAFASPALAAYAAEPSPTTRAVHAMRTPVNGGHPGAIALHQTFQRPLEAEGALPVAQLPSPPRREWLEWNRYWLEGHTDTLWLLADPRRTDLALIDPVSRGDHTDFAWRFSSLSQLGGMRPPALTWYRLRPPGWFAHEGWSLTPETAGVAREMGRGPHVSPITASVRRRSDPVQLMIGGRHLGDLQSGPVHFSATHDGKPLVEWDAVPGFFLRFFELPAGTFGGNGALANLSIQSSAANGRQVPTAIEQFDLQTRGSMMWGFDEGWHESEYDATRGAWRWTSDRAALHVVDATTPLVVRLVIESPLRYFDAPSAVTMTADGALVAQTLVSETGPWVVTVPLDTIRSANGVLTIETNQTFVPAERGGPPDRRRLGLRIFGVDVTPQK